MKALLPHEDTSDSCSADLNSNEQCSPEVVSYYRQTIEDYQLWSPRGYMHFGLWKPWLNPLNRNSMLEAMNDLVFESLHLRDDQPKTICDLGCGLGAVSRYGCQQFPQHQWHAITICDDQVSFATSSLTAEQAARVSVLQGDYCHLPFESESIDAAFFLESLCHAEHPIAPLSEAYRVLKPGGRLMVIDGLMNQVPAQTPRIVQRLADTVAENWAVGRFHSLPDFLQATKDAGFGIESNRELGWQITPCVAHSPALVAWHSMRLVLEGNWNAWKRKHMIACGLGVLLGAMRYHFGYYAYCMTK